MGHERQTVDGDLAFEVIQVFAEGIPAPILVVDILVEHAAQVFDQDFARLGFGRHRRAGGAAIADDDAGDAIVHHRIAVGILDDEGVHMGMRIDETGRDHMPFGVDLFLAAAEIFADGGDLIAIDGDIRLESRTAAAVDDVAVFDDYIMSHNLLSSLGSVRCFAYPTEM